MAAGQSDKSDDGGFAVTRVFEAPRLAVWKAYTELDRLTQWWGPQGFERLGFTLDLRPGGMFHYGMRAPNGKELWGKFVYREIAAPERLVFVVSFSDAQGGTQPNPFTETWPVEILNTVLFSEEAGRTTLAMTGTPTNATEAECHEFKDAREPMARGFKGTLDQLAAYLARPEGR